MAGSSSTPPDTLGAVVAQPRRSSLGKPVAIEGERSRIATDELTRDAGPSPGRCPSASTGRPSRMCSAQAARTCSRVADRQHVRRAVDHAQPGRRRSHLHAPPWHGRQPDGPATGGRRDTQRRAVVVRAVVQPGAAVAGNGDDLVRSSRPPRVSRPAARIEAVFPGRRRRPPRRPRRSRSTCSGALTFGSVTTNPSGTRPDRGQAAGRAYAARALASRARSS